MKIIKKIISAIIAFILALLIVLACIIGYINNDIFNETNMSISMKDTNYYYNIYTIIQNTANDYVMQSGFNEIVLDNVITERQVSNDIKEVLSYIYNNEEIKLNLDKVKEELHSNIKKQIEIKKYNIDENMQNDINEFEDSIIEEYRTNIYYSQKVANSIGKYMSKIREIINITLIAVWVSIVILVYVIYKLNKPSIGISLLISGIFLIILKIHSTVNIAVNNILILNWAFSKTMIFVVNSLIQKIFITGIILVAIGTVVIIVYEYRENKKDSN